MKQILLTIIFTFLITFNVYAYNPAYIDETGTIYEFDKTSTTGADNSFTVYYLVQPEYDHAAFTIDFDYFGQAEVDGEKMDFEFVYDFLIDSNFLEEKTDFGNIYRIQIPIENGKYNFAPMGRTYTLSFDANDSFMGNDYKTYEERLSVEIQNNTQSFNVFAIYANDYEWVKSITPDFMAWAQKKYSALNPSTAFYSKENAPVFQSETEDIFETSEVKTEIVDVEVTIEEETDENLPAEKTKKVYPMKIFTYIVLSGSIFLLGFIVFLVYIKVKEKN